MNFLNYNKSADAQYKRMTETPVNKLIATLAVPTVISMLITMIYNMADTYFVSKISVAASGATGVVLSLMAILQAFGFMYGQGAGSNISRRLGAKDIETARRYCTTAFFWALFTGGVIMLLGLLFLSPLMKALGSTDTILPYASDYGRFILIAGPAMTTSCVMNNILRLFLDDIVGWLEKHKFTLLGRKGNKNGKKFKREDSEVGGNPKR